MGNIVPKFGVGDLVFHKTNSEIKMIILNSDNDDVDNGDEILYECSWIDKQGKYHTEDMFEMELLAAY